MQTWDIVSRITAQPSLAQFEVIVAVLRRHKGFGNKPSAEILEIYSAILSSKLVSTFQTEKAGLNALAEVFRTPAGLGCLTSHLKIGPQAEVPAVIKLLEHILSTNISQLLNSNYKESSNLFFGSRLLAAVSAKPGEHSWIGDVSSYSRWLARNMIEGGSRDPKLLERAVKLGAPQEYLREYLLEVRNIELLGQILIQMRGAQLLFVITQALVPLLPSSPSHSSRILASLSIDPEILADLCVRLPADIQTIRSAVVLAKHRNRLNEITAKLGQEWASKVAIERTSLARQQTLTQYLLAACASMDSESAKQFSHSNMLLNGVSNRLSSTSASIRNLGTLLAEAFAKQAGVKLEFGIKYSDYDWWIGIDTIDPELRPLTNAGTTYPGSESQSTPLSQILDPEEKEDSDDEEEIFGDDAESDEEVPALFYVKDLIAYLRSDKYAEVQCALAAGSSLILRKAQFGSEVTHYAEEVLRTTCGLTDKFSIKGFAEQRQSILNAVVTANPSDAGPMVVKLFVTSNWSLAQRQCLLASLVFAAHSLAEGTQEEHFGQLPGALHSMFISPQDRMIEQIQGQPQRNVIEGTGSHVVRRSRKLEPHTKHPHKNRFSSISSRFFFPLFAAQPPLRQSSYDAIVYAQWLRTLGVIMTEAYPSQHIPRMTSEIWPLLKALALSSDKQEVVVQEAIYSCIVMVIGVAAALVLQDFPNDVGVMTDSVAANLNRASTPQVLNAARLALAALADLAKQIEQRILTAQS